MNVNFRSTFAHDILAPLKASWCGGGIGYNTTPPTLSYSGVVKVSTAEWNDTLLSSVMRVGSVYMRVMDLHVYGSDLVNLIFRSTFAHDTQAPLQASRCGGGIVYNWQSHFVFLQGKVKIYRYIAHDVNSVLL